MGGFDRNEMDSILSGMGSIFSVVMQPVLAMVVGVVYGLMFSENFHGAKILAAAAWMIVFFPFVMWLNLWCIPVGILYVYLLYWYWWKQTCRLGVWFWICGISAGYGYLFSGAAFWPIPLFWILLVMIWLGIRLYIRRNYRILESMHAKDFYTKEELSRPPMSQGICQTCDRYSEHIYYLPDGSRVCERCYQPIKEEENSKK